MGSDASGGKTGETARRIEPMESSCLAGHFLIAMPAMVDPNFRGTVTYLCEHNERGALGVVVNRPTDLTMESLLNKLRSRCPTWRYRSAKSIWRPGERRAWLCTASFARLLEFLDCRQ